MSSIKKRLFGNFGGSTYALLVTTLTQLFSIPLFLHFWGSSAYGEWLVLSAIASYLSLSDVGFSKVASNRMAMLVASNNYESARMILHSAWVFLLGMSSIVLLISVLIIPWLPLKEWLNLSHATPEGCVTTVVILNIYALLCLQGEIFGAIYRSAYQVLRGAIILNTFRLLDFIVIMITISASKSTVDVSICLALSRLIGNVMILTDCYHLEQKLRLGWKLAKLGEIKNMIKPSLAFMCFPVGHSIPSQGMTLIINAILGSTAVVVFNTARILTRIIVQGMNLIKAAVWPEISHLIATGDLPRAQTVHRFTVQTTLLSVLVGGLAILILGPSVIGLWTHHSVTIGTETLAIFVFGVILNSIWLSSAVVLEATNQHVGLGWRFLSGSIISLLLACILTPIFGINGAVFALIAVDCMLIPYVLRTSCTILKDSPWRIFNKFEVLAPLHLK